MEVIMTGIRNTNCSNIFDEVLFERGLKSKGRKTSGPFGVFVYDLTEDILAQRREVKERAKLKYETGERWTENSLFKNDLNSTLGYTVNKDAINKVREKLKSEGIDPSKRTPTHNITDEQMAQLSEKYDFEYLSIAEMEDIEYGNFLLDLAYMNVFSCDELEEEFFGVSDINANSKACLYCTPNDGSKPYYVGQNGRHYNSYEDFIKSVKMDYICSKYPEHTESDYLDIYEDYMAKTEERLNVISDFLVRALKYYDYGLTDTVKPVIEDASEKFREDFGGRF